MATSGNIRQPGYFANFDSATAMLEGLGACLHGRDFPLLRGPAELARARRKTPDGAINKTPVRLQRKIYSLAGGNEAIAIDKLEVADAEHNAQRMVAQYPQRRYPAVAIGSCNGALIHLCTALASPGCHRLF